MKIYSNMKPRDLRIIVLGAVLHDLALEGMYEVAEECRSERDALLLQRSKSAIKTK